MDGKFNGGKNRGRASKDNSKVVADANGVQQSNLGDKPIILGTKVNKFTDPRDACSAIAAESYRLWLEHENRTDDITIIIVHINDLDNSGAGSTDRTSVVDTKAALLVAEKGRTEKLHFMGSEDHPLRSESFSEVQPNLHEFPADRNPASVAPSPTHPNSLET